MSLTFTDTGVVTGCNTMQVSTNYNNRCIKDRVVGLVYRKPNGRWYFMSNVDVGLGATSMAEIAKKLAYLNEYRAQ